MLPKALVELAEKVVSQNQLAGKTIAIAESCTGGLVSAAITEIAGASKVLDRSYVTYSNEAKMQALGVSEDLISTFGAVSIAVAWAMARGALEKSGADISVAITGVAGPDGGTEKKPVGTVIFACAKKGDDPEKVVADMKNFDPTSGRSEIRLQAALCALELLLP